MAKVTLYNMAGENVGEKVLSDAVFGIEPNKNVLHDVVKNFLANQRQGTQSTLTRSEVRGGGRKPWRQKGTGHARQGSTRAPQWTHGGIALGPKPRSYAYTLNRKVKVLALKSALSAKVQDNEFIVIDNLTVDEYKTKTIAAMLKALGVSKKATIVTAEPNAKLIASAGNIAGVSTNVVNALNAYEVMNAGKFIISAEAVDKLEEVYNK